jgi:hypothetical protein
VETDTYRKKIELGERLFQTGKISEALDTFESVLENDPNNTEALNDKGVVLNSLRNYEEAIHIFSDILSIDQTNSNAVFNLISNYFAVEKWKEAENIFKEYGHCLAEQDVAMIKRDIEKNKSSSDKKRHSDTINDPGLFDYEKMQERVGKVLRKDLFFIMGVPKSGTTWLQYLLNGHPDIWCSGEGGLTLLLEQFYRVVNEHNKYVTDKNKNIGTTNYPLFRKEDLQTLLVAAFGLLLSHWEIDSTITCIGLKDPTLAKTIEVYAPLLPNAKFIHTIREGRDVIVSGWFNNLRRDEEATKKRWPTFQSFVEFGVGEWVSDIQKARSCGRAYPERYFELRYEDLRRDPDTIIRQVLGFLGVDGSKSMVGRCRQAGEFKKLSKGRQRGQEDRNAFFRKGIIGDWKNHFDQECLEVFMQHGGDLLRDLGY